MADGTAEPRYLRFTVSDRLEHWVQVVAFTGLAITGLVQSFSEGRFPKSIITTLGGINNTRFVHRSFGVLVLLTIAYHLGTAGYRFFVTRTGRSMIPGLNDARAAAGTITFNLGVRKEPPREGRFTFTEKVEYWAIIWGTVIMAVTGLMMWNPIATTNLLPGQFIPAAKAAHAAEAVLAVLAVLIWHAYYVHIKRFNRSMFGGYLDEQEMVEEHPVELDAIKAGAEPVVVPSDVLRRRRRVFFPTYAAIVLLGAAFLVMFLSYQEIAIRTVTPPEVGVEIYTPYDATADEPVP